MWPFLLLLLLLLLRARMRSSFPRTRAPPPRRKADGLWVVRLRFSRPAHTPGLWSHLPGRLTDGLWTCVGCFAPPPYSGSILPNLDTGSHNRRTAPPLTYFGLVSADLGFSQGDSPPNIQPHLALLRPPLGSASREPSPFAAVTTLWGRIAAQRYTYLHTRTRSWTTSRNYSMAKLRARSARV